jgi:hypothetical protein
MARTPFAAVVLAATMASCGSGYEPPPDRASDPLTPSDRAAVERALRGLGLFCAVEEEKSAAVEELVTPDTSILGGEEALDRVSRKRPHGVYRTTREDEFVDLRAFNGDTMIQVLERAAHEFNACLGPTARDMRDWAKRLRSRR